MPAGVGFATLRAILKLWIGFPGTRSGVFSAGNGPAMRSAILGVCYGDQPDTLCELVSASTRLTHTDPKAECGALAVALAAYCASQASITADSYVQKLRDLLNAARPDWKPEITTFLDLVTRAAESAAAGQSAETFAETLGLRRGVTGYIYHTAPVVLHAWFSHPRDYRNAVLAVIRCGGDTDTTAAITGGIIGAGVGKQGIPAAWLADLWEWPQSVTWMERLSAQLAVVLDQQVRQQPLPFPVYGIWPRNLFFLMVVLAHGLRRLWPPY